MSGNKDRRSMSESASFRSKRSVPAQRDAARHNLEKPDENHKCGQANNRNYNTTQHSLYIQPGNHLRGGG
jgi:hypothetical protein